MGIRFGFVSVNTEKNGFTMVEALLVLAFMGVLSLASVPMLTQLTQKKTGYDVNTVKCINNTTNPSWYNDTTGVTSSATSGSTCEASINRATYNKGQAIYTASWFANHGTDPQKIMGKKILRAACDAGGEKACDYFINVCTTSASTTSPYCDDTSNYLDLSYYLHQVYGTTTNAGARYIFNKMTIETSKFIPNQLAELSYSCTNNQQPDSIDSSYQNLNTNIACSLLTAEILIRACNLDIQAACELAYANDYNTSCTAVLTNWTTAPTGTYKLAPDGNSTTRSVDCELTSLITAAISGCNATAYVPDDCTSGYNNNYNRSCSQIFDNYSLNAATYNLTSSGAPPTDPVSTFCDPIALCVADGVGTECYDETIYVGNDGTNYYFTTKNDLGLYSWNNGYSTSYTNTGTWYGTGETCTNTLATSTTFADRPFNAANGCYNLEYNGKTDWWLPNLTELNTYLYTNKTTIGNFSNAEYWSSTEYYDIMNSFSKNFARIINFSSGTSTWDYKTSTKRVRCMRKQTL